MLMLATVPLIGLPVSAGADLQPSWATSLGQLLPFLLIIQLVPGARAARAAESDLLAVVGPRQACGDLA